MKPILLDFPEKFETDRLVISSYDVGDGEDFFQILQSNYHHLQEEIREIHTIQSVDDAEEYVRYKRVEWITRKRLVPKIVENATGTMVGQLWIEPRWNRMIFEIGYFIVEGCQGKGYITEAVKRMAAFLFNDLQANKLVIHTKATNKKSIGVAEGCGFTKEACIREGGRTNEGEIVDMLYFGLLKSEYGVETK